MAFLLKKLSFFQAPFPRGVAVEIFRSGTRLLVGEKG